LWGSTSQISHMHNGKAQITKKEAIGA